MTTDNVLIKVENLCKSFDDVEVLKGINAEIDKGDVMVVIGASGSGKSTFLRCLNLLEEPTSGTISFEGVDITDESVDINIHRQKMGMVFQQFNLFPHMTVLRNLTLGPTKLLRQSRAEAEANAMKLLERVGLADRANAYPSQLSGGQKQRIAIVRALAMNPDVSHEAARARRHDHGGRHPRDGLCAGGRHRHCFCGRGRHCGAGLPRGIFRQSQVSPPERVPLQGAVIPYQKNKPRTRPIHLGRRPLLCLRGL